ncbi:pilus assembly protein N-terminal domain-containing protein [uncultured Desulfosarcina sp.]|uniref:type II and III secretion system protein family protein n=1 Tax=uncultured Desulfosarcina sp. TaxID=218289 RepID=UPI0029C77DE3|nr:pilus assembly protein N-terminal domain-containing protein [uncultured Desulfosarcina sp.]
MNFTISSFFALALRLAAAGMILLFSLSTPAVSADLRPSETIEGIYLGKTFVYQAAVRFERVAVGHAGVAVVRALSDDTLLIKGNKPGRTNLILWPVDGSPPVSLDLKVDVDPLLIADVEKMVGEMVPDAEVRIVSANGTLILDGTVTSLTMMQRVLQIVSAYFGEKTDAEEDAQQASTIVIGDSGSYSAQDDEGQLGQNLNTKIAIRNNLIVVRGPQQVQLEVKIAEVSRSGVKQMGLAYLYNGSEAFSFVQGGDVSGSSSLARPSTNGTTVDENNIISSTAELATPFSSAFQLLFHSSNRNNLALLNLLKGQGLARYLATPTLVAMSGQEATFQVGGSFPIPSSNSNGTDINYREYGVLLRFTPVVLDRETISLQVNPEVSSPDWTMGTYSGGVAVPGTKERTASTTLQLKDGQSFVMAGLLKEEMYTEVSKLPLLGDIPVLGSLFTNKEYSKDESELIIVVTPRLVRPLEPFERPPLPGENWKNEIGDLDFYLTNDLDFRSRAEDSEAVTQADMEQGQKAFSGDVGYAQ